MHYTIWVDAMIAVAHGSADFFVVWLIRGEVKLHAGVETPIC